MAAQPEMAFPGLLGPDVARGLIRARARGAEVMGPLAVHPQPNKLLTLNFHYFHFLPDKDGDNQGSGLRPRKQKLQFKT